MASRSAPPASTTNLWLFENLSRAEVEVLATAAQRRRLPSGQAIFRQGSQANQMFLIKGGQVKLNKVTEKGDEITPDIRKARGFLGENMLNEEGFFSVTATTLSNTVLCGFSKAAFERLILAHPNIGLQVIRNLSKRIGWLTSRVGSMSHSNLEERLYRVLANVAREYGQPGRQGFVLPFPFTHKDLAFLVSAHRVNITRTLNGLTETDLVFQEGHTLAVAPEDLT